MLWVSAGNGFAVVVHVPRSKSTGGESAVLTLNPEGDVLVLLHSYVSHKSGTFPSLSRLQPWIISHGVGQAGLETLWRWFCISCWGSPCCWVGVSCPGSWAAGSSVPGAAWWGCPANSWADVLQTGQVAPKWELSKQVQYVQCLASLSAGYLSYSL